MGIFLVMFTCGQIYGRLMGDEVLGDATFSEGGETDVFRCRRFERLSAESTSEKVFRQTNVRV